MRQERRTFPRLLADWFELAGCNADNPIDRFGKDTHRNSIRDQRRASLGLSSAGKVRICYLKHAEPERERFSVLFAMALRNQEMIKNGGNE